MASKDEFKLLVGTITAYCSTETTDSEATIIYQELDEYLDGVVQSMVQRFPNLRIEGSY